MDEKTSPLDELLESVSSAARARCANLVERVRRIELALESYRRAVEGQLAREFAREHSLKLPAAPALSPERAAELLKLLVDALPEQRAPGADVDVAPATLSGTVLGDLTLVEAQTAPLSSHPGLLAATKQAKIVVIGALSGRERGSALPAEFSESVEWIDTERDGAHAIGNLPQRVRQRRVAAVIILDRAVQHKHTEPVVAQAREHGVPVAFAGQGGKASLQRALAQIELALSQKAKP
ncbi:MAG: hypothetical protein QM756_37245 [Polyangiaceae bacterium]